MAVEAPHITLFPPQSLPNREMIHQPSHNISGDHGLQTAYQMPHLPTTKTETLLPIYASADSRLTSSLLLSRKRSRDSSAFNLPLSLPNAPPVHQNQLGTFTFLGQDVSMHIYQQQLEMERFIAHHTEKVRSEMEDMRKRNSTRLIAAAKEGMRKRLRAKEEQVMKMGKLNWALEEKVKSLSLENQIWRELAETNEATAKALRNNLQQVVAEVEMQQQRVELAETGQSWCGSNKEDGGERKGKDEDEYCSRYGRRCRNCGKEESCVLLLPCRHLCVCSVCGSSIGICPVCQCTKSTGVHVNLS